MFINRLSSLAGAFALSVGFASSAAAQDQPHNNCFGVDLLRPELDRRMVLKNDPEEFRALADQIRNLSGCKMNALYLEMAADFHEMNNLLPQINADIQGWVDAGRPTPYPTSDAILQLNNLIYKVTGDENYLVDNGFYTGTTTAILQLADSRFTEYPTGAYLEIRSQSALFLYMQELALASLDVGNAFQKYMNSLADQGLIAGFINCVRLEDIPDITDTYNKASEEGNPDPLVQATGFCSFAYSQATPDIKEFLSDWLIQLMTANAQTGTPAASP